MNPSNSDTNAEKISDVAADHQSEEKLRSDADDLAEFEDDIERFDRNQPFRLEQFMKVNNIASSGGQAKVLIQSGQIMVNRQIETRRKRQLVSGDTINFLDETWIVP